MWVGVGVWVCRCVVGVVVGGVSANWRVGGRSRGSARARSAPTGGPKTRPEVVGQRLAQNHAAGQACTASAAKMVNPRLQCSQAW